MRNQSSCGTKSSKENVARRATVTAASTTTRHFEITLPRQTFLLSRWWEEQLQYDVGNFHSPKCTLHASSRGHFCVRQLACRSLHFFRKWLGSNVCVSQIWLQDHRLVTEIFSRSHI